MPDALFRKEFAEARGLPLVKLVFKLKRIFRVSWKSVLYRISSQSPDGAKLWPRFQWEYKALTGRTLGKADEPDGLVAEDFSLRATVRQGRRRAGTPRRGRLHGGPSLQARSQGGRG